MTTAMYLSNAADTLLGTLYTIPAVLIGPSSGAALAQSFFISPHKGAAAGLYATGAAALSLVSEESGYWWGARAVVAIPVLVGVPHFISRIFSAKNPQAREVVSDWTLRGVNIAFLSATAASLVASAPTALAVGAIAGAASVAYAKKIDAVEKRLFQAADAWLNGK